MASRPSELWVVGELGAPATTKITNNHHIFTTQWSLSIPAGRSVALVHSCLQRQRWSSAAGRACSACAAAEPATADDPAAATPRRWSCNRGPDPTVRRPMRTDRPPPMLLLQGLNVLMGVGILTAIARCQTVWQAWSPAAVAVVMVLCNLAYGALVSFGGRRAERVGRARAAAQAALLGVAGALACLTSDPWLALVGLFAVFAASAGFFPANAGLISDAASGSVAPPLHRKVASYNLGWATGNAIGMVAAGVLAGAAAGVQVALPAMALALIAAVLWRWRALPPLPPPAEGDRAPHPDLPRLTFNARLANGIACTVGMGLISLLAIVLAGERVDGAPRGMVAAQHLAAWLMVPYALGYIVCFAWLGVWTGWILRPWRMLLVQAVMPLGAGVLLLGPLTPVWLAGGGLLIGFGFGALYAASLFYSLRLPAGSSRAAGWHETYVGLGNTLGPALLGLTVVGIHPGFTGLAAAAAVLALLAVAVQVPLLLARRQASQTN